MTKSVFEACKKLLDAHFNEHKPEVAKLETFSPEENATLGPLLRLNVEIPIDPLDDKLSMLLYGLEDRDNCKDTQVYQHLEQASRRVMPTALYATSGGGKTRSLFEYLSHNKGLYFVADDDLVRSAPNQRRNAGSGDMGHIFRRTQFWEKAEAGTKEGKRQVKKIWT